MGGTLGSTGAMVAEILGELREMGAVHLISRCLHQLNPRLLGPPVCQLPGD